LPHRWRVQTLAFHGEKGQLIDGIENAEFTPEFQAIDNNRLRPEPDMLGPEITVCLDDFSFTHSLAKQLGFFLQERELGCGDFADQLFRQPIYWIGQFPQIGLHVFLELLSILRLTKLD
jgi:hypothetical protein